MTVAVWRPTAGKTSGVVRRTEAAIVGCLSDDEVADADLGVELMTGTSDDREPSIVRFGRPR